MLLIKFGHVPSIIQVFKDNVVRWHETYHYTVQDPHHFG